MRCPSLRYVILSLLIVPIWSTVPAVAQTVIRRSPIVEPNRDYYYPHTSGSSYEYREYYSPNTYPGRSAPRDRIIRGEVEDSTLIQPIIIDSTIENSTLVNPTIVTPSQSSRTDREYRSYRDYNGSRGNQEPRFTEQRNPACMAFSDLRIACQ